MNLNSCFSLLAQMGTSSAQTVPNQKGQMLQMVGMVAIMFFLMYWLMYRPQKQREKQLQDLMKALKPGDKVVTASGILGVVITVKEKAVTLRSADTKLEVLKSTIAEITEKSGETASA